ncbi:unnamed protein product [Chrysodeixis includens]|uniref:Uncharacterized protein n=1 Tax=Chrysodeixis includens TaxID=689277 RepID=A0A9N8KZP7_CHRIL|nr:unnamed protein product [Chrysodeixis includens]
MCTVPRERVRAAGRGGRGGARRRGRRRGRAAAARTHLRARVLAAVGELGVGLGGRRRVRRLLAAQLAARLLPLAQLAPHLAQRAALRLRGGLAALDEPHRVLLYGRELVHERGQVVGVGARRGGLVVERQRLVELGEVSLRLGSGGLRGGGVGLVFGGRQRRLELTTGGTFGFVRTYSSLVTLCL